MVSSSWREEISDDWEAALERPDGRPWLAMATGTIAVLVVTIVALNLVPVEVAAHGAAALGAVTLVAALVWGVAWFLTLRDATTGWQIGVGAVIWGMALLTVAAAIAWSNIAVRLDIADARRLRVDANGDPYMPPGMHPGPIARTMFDFLHDMTSEQHKRRAEFQVMGMDRLHDAWMVSNTPGILKDCGRFARIEPEIAASDIATAIKYCNIAGRSSRRALFELGRAYAANKQPAEATAAWRKAAEKGSTSAMVELGVLYATGAGVAKDDGQARKLFERAAQGGNPRGVSNLAALSSSGGAPSDQ